ncbi:putative norsolorinic acid [Diaporthe ampelina]|uniref:Putative norsolorinic acid n=1 Tax=Diaporthe ampelina TaxID=1214573 RepID=A0A0G2HCS0_9PEZI|nr:putative norsolorinic acid [Diaporthe ampelina]
MIIGDAWSMVMGDLTKDNAFELLEAFYDLGGNFIDTANNYHSGQSRRSEMVITTKYTMSTKTGHPVQQSNFGGAGSKSLHMSIRSSLEALQTDYVDISEVLYLGISDAPAPDGHQGQHGRYSAQERDLEREVIPMYKEEGMALMPFGVLGGGLFKSPDSPEQGGRSVPPPLRAGREEAISKVLDAVAKRQNVPITGVALAHALQKSPNLFPILGGRKVEHLKANVEALSLELTPEDVQEIEKGYEFDIGFPHKFMSSTGNMITVHRTSKFWL